MSLSIIKQWCSFFSFLFSVLWCSQIGNNTYGYFASFFGYKPTRCESWTFSKYFGYLNIRTYCRSLVILFFKILRIRALFFHKIIFYVSKSYFSRSKKIWKYSPQKKNTNRKCFFFFFFSFSKNGLYIYILGWHNNGQKELITKRNLLHFLYVASQNLWQNLPLKLLPLVGIAENTISLNLCENPFLLLPRVFVVLAMHCQLPPALSVCR